MKPTIKEVAALAGVSTATISKYLNGTTVKERNKIAIDKAIAQLNYQINPTARGLRTNRTMTVGILIPELDNQFSTKVVSSIENVLMPHGYSTIICDYKSDPKLETYKLRFLLSKSVEAIVWMPLYATKRQAADISDKIVLIDRVVEGAQCDCVVIDNIRATYEPTCRLIENGHTNIAILCGQERISTSKQRLNGYLKAFSDYKIPVKSEYIFSGEYTEQSGYQLTIRALNLPLAPTAIIATNNELTLGSISALLENGVEIPNHISFVGFDNEKIARIMRPKLTMVLQPLEEIAEQTAELILRRLTKSCSLDKTTIILEPIFLFQDSIAPLTSN